MAQWTKAERERKIEHAKQLYCKGFDFETIADIMGDVKPVTIERWAKDFDFEKSKRSQLIALSEIRNSILESYADMLDGKKPKVTPDAAAKYATAFEKFSSKKQVLTYMYEAYEMLCEELMTDIQKAESRKQKEDILDVLKYIRGLMEKVLTKLTNEVLGNE
ncbi:hypothetical protein [Dysgonomonas sp. 520]|uniref:hypothetical protein n=1 Tax=Dysgonomonas sp. 520 TaxID=2302931 RepID=UPI0013D2ADD1|nr:hypothetical protein [Dysgonomonas sp. 520]NDW10460.1 hypothetical protein [Dysgonomonas sp. 520]